MGGKFSRDKGARCEREIITLLVNELGDDLEIGRNLSQTRDGGCDVAGRLPYSIEVKSQAKLLLGAWWAQACSQATPGRPPVLIYKKPYKGWFVIMELDLISVFPTDNGDTIEMDIFAFCAVTREIIASAIPQEEYEGLRLDS